MKFRFVLLDPDGDPDPNESDLPSEKFLSFRYEQSGSNIVKLEQRESGLKATPLTNFYARIVRDIVIDDGDVQRRHFGVEGGLPGATVAFSLSAMEFSRMGWVLSKFGPQAIIYPGQHQHARAAIQWLSREIQQERIFAHLGWRKQGTQWIYLGAGGALGANGAVAGLQVQVPAALECFQFTPPGGQNELVGAVRASLRFLSVAPDCISFPLLAAVYRAPFGKPDFSVFLTGQTGTFKTALAALCQQHFGPDMDASSLPANFASTANALESLAFTAKDTLLVVDDFVPIGGSGDNALQAVAERLFRAAGNCQGRGRMGANGHLRPAQPPRALILATGEEVPRGQSLRARLLIIEVAPGDVDRHGLTECQEAAHLGLFAAAMGGFLAWVAGRYEQLQRLFDARSKELRNHYRNPDCHARLPAALASLQSGFEIWLQFAFEAGAIVAVEQKDLLERNAKALNELAKMQTRYHQAADPALRFLRLLRTGLASGHAHVANRLGKAPEDPATWGWRHRTNGRGWLPQGARIGWIAGTDLYLDSAVSFKIAQQLAAPEHLPVSEQTLRHRLRERGLLASVDPGREMLQVRRTLEGRPRQVLHVKINHLTE